MILTIQLHKPKVLKHMLFMHLVLSMQAYIVKVTLIQLLATVII